MLHEEALDVLGLNLGATSAEVKEAYRDLVKVWHPDRFGSDPRLRQKAEEKLRQVNDAYRILQSPLHPDFTLRRNTEPPAASHKSGVRPGRAVGWILGSLGIAVVVIAATFAFAHNSRQAPDTPETQPQESASVANHVESSPAPKVRPKASTSSHAAEQVRVRRLSETEAAQLESACPREMDMKDPAGYENCVRAQLDPTAPDMSTLSASDRAGIESACRKTKIREGTAAYNRCLTRMVKLLNDSSRP